MWQILSFTGRFDPSFFGTLAAPLPPKGKPTEERNNNRLAVLARTKRRVAVKCARRREDTPCASFTTEQQQLLKLYDNGTLLANANRLTKLSGNGRLRHVDGSFLDIGGSTGGYTRMTLYDWQPPDVSRFNP